MIHFNFIVSDEEAETIFSALSDEIDDCRLNLLMCERQLAQPGHIKWYEGRMTYLEALKEKMTNSKVS